MRGGGSSPLFTFPDYTGFNKVYIKPHSIYRESDYPAHKGSWSSWL